MLLKNHKENNAINCVLYFHRYPNYEFISDNSISWSAGLHNRYTENSLRGVILDIHFLSQADFLVCTFSSQVKCNAETMLIMCSSSKSYFSSCFCLLKYVLRLQAQQKITKQYFVANMLIHLIHIWQDMISIQIERFYLLLLLFS